MRDRFLKEAPPRWEEYRRFEESLQGYSTSDRREVRRGAKKSLELRLEWKRRGGSWFNQVEQTSTEGYRGDVTCENPRYCFSLARKKKDAPWAVDGILLKPTEAAPAPPIKPGLGLSMLGGYPTLPELVANGTIVIETVEAEQFEGEELVRVVFKGPIRKLQDPEGGMILGGWMLLDAKRDWVIRRLAYEEELRLPSKKVTGKTSLDAHYRDSPSGHPIPTRSTIRGKSEGFDPTPIAYETNVVFDLTERRAIPEEEFTLAAFGLPEPAGVVRPPSRWYLWAAGAGIACLVAALIVRRFRKTA